MDLSDLFISKACLLHGDLWLGNILCGVDQSVYFIEPAVYHGDPEADLAMTECFQRFPNEFYEAYVAHKPLQAGYELRRPIYNLYHLLNHWWLFGEAYASVYKKTLAGFSI
jgi:fructosamine-3-kinase